MPNSDTWPRAVSVETLPNMDSARSCDSVISVNSACSEDSMEHLSAEEKACLMYLEETIESLDLQEDSGFSNDEPDPANLRKSHDDSESEPVCSHILSVLESGSGKAEAWCDPDDTLSHPQCSTHDTDDVPSPDAAPAAPASASGGTTPVPPGTESTSDGDPQEAELRARASCDVDLSVIPPPSDFMDEPLSPPSPHVDVTVETLSQRESEKNIPVSPTLSPVSLSSLNDPAPVSLISLSPAPQEIPADELSAPTHLNPSSPRTEASPRPVEPKSPPPVAPKPKLPPNIIIKSHKSTGGHESTTGSHTPGGTDRLMMDPQRVRMEALRKLGLLKSEEAESGSAAKAHSRRSWAPSSSPLSPTSPRSAPPSVPHSSAAHSSFPVPTPAPASHQTPSPTPPVPPLPDIIPVPADFSDPVDDGFMGVGGQDSPVPDKVRPLEQDKRTLGQLRNTRPRPASLGSGKDFSGARGTRPAPSSSQHSDSSQKLPRSQGISVLICPRAQSDEARREALKKLGLLRD